MILSGEGSPGASGAGTVMENAAHAIAVAVNLRSRFKKVFFMVMSSVKKYFSLLSHFFREKTSDKVVPFYSPFFTEKEQLCHLPGREKNDILYV